MMGLGSMMAVSTNCQWGCVQKLFGLLKTLVRRYPAEWESHDSIWLAWPHDREEWGVYFDRACEAVSLLISELSKDTSESIQVLVPAQGHSRPITGCVEHDCLYGDIWLRDTLPIFAQVDNLIEAQIFEFNGWGEKFIFNGDRELAQVVASLARTNPTKYALVLEGGAIEGNGADTLLTTRECLLNSNRNPRRSESDIEDILHTALGTRKLIWLDRGLEGDHTDGHIDNLARFVGESQVVCTASTSRGEPNEKIYQDILTTLKSARTANGDSLEVVTLPSPGRIDGPEGIMAASYCNFLLTNCCVVIPVFDRPSDTVAMSILGDLFPSRRVVPIPSYALLTGGGTIHCISKEQASPHKG